MLFVSLLSYLYIDGVIIFLASFFLVPFSLPFSLIFPFSVFPVCLTVCLSVSDGASELPSEQRGFHGCVLGDGGGGTGTCFIGPQLKT